ncbi:hypothetical protein [Mesorhizobium sp.]|uniref:hypothetical protein n=1 Tax=Mesorhizobium sp. TaxID=1871066 RepID=UPI000FE78FC8|nr:hypothetical protein [Mesorhizobium sp.]RWP05097.1 MAG: hypothetical protein EOQ99_16640 [Mesorhizobium sp.]
MADTPTLAQFFTGWAEDGLSKDGLPHYRETVKIRLSRPPYLKLEREATEADFEEYSGPYALFQKEQQAKKKTPPSAGFPLVLWAAVSAAELQMLSARDVFTIEQLAKLSGRGANDGMPGELRDLADRAKKMIELSKEMGKYEAMVRDRDGQIAALKEQVTELRGTVQAQDGIINSLKARVA